MKNKISILLLIALSMQACSKFNKSINQSSQIYDSISVSDQNFNPIEGKKKLKVLSKWLNKMESNNETDEFTIIAEKDNSIICDQGTRIKIDANSLISTKTGKPVKGKVKIRVKEYYRISDFVFNNLNTASDDKLLETGGTIHIEAKANNEILDIQAGKEVEIRFPTSDFKSGMMLFNGVQTETGMNWNLSPLYQKMYINTKEIDSIDSPASHPEGYKAFDKFITDSARYPQSGHKNAAEGPVFVRFTVRRDGSITNIHLVEKRHPSLDSAALALINKLPKFKPAIYKKRRCSYSITVPIKYYLWYNKYNVQHYLKLLEYKYLTGKDDPDYNPATEPKDEPEAKEYILITSKLGWINCDRFINRNPIEMQIKTEASDVKIMFKNLKSVLQANNTERNIFSLKAPIGEPIVIFAIKFVKKQMYLAIAETEVGKTNYKLNYKSTSTKEFQETLNGYN